MSATLYTTFFTLHHLMHEATLTTWCSHADIGVLLVYMHFALLITPYYNNSIAPYFPVNIDKLKRSVKYDLNQESIF